MKHLQGPLNQVMEGLQAAMKQLPKELKKNPGNFSKEEMEKVNQELKKIDLNKHTKILTDARKDLHKFLKKYR